MKKLLPPVLFLVFALLMGVVCWAFGFEHLVPFPYNLIGLPFFLAGLIFAQKSKNLFLQLKTNVNTFDNPDKLVTAELYKYSRNPMYLGMLISISGLAILYQGSLSSFIFVILFFIITDRWYVKFEETVLTKKFGDEYRNYCLNTRRWI